MYRRRRLFCLIFILAALLYFVGNFQATFGNYTLEAGAIDLSEAACIIQASQIGRNANVPTVCQCLACKKAYIKHLRPAEDHFGRICHPIPQVRHLLWRSENVSAYFAQQLATWRQVHPDWTVVLWRDQDLVKFVRKHFPGALNRFQELAPHTIMQVDMIRYMLLFKYGGVYADLDYSLVSSLDEYRQFYAVVTREPEIHALQYYGLRWPPRTIANPAFLMSAPGHIFYRHCIERLQTRPYLKGSALSFGGPFGLTDILEEYASLFPISNSPLETVYVPPSFSFYPYENNRLNTSKSAYLPNRLKTMTKACSKTKPSAEQLRRYCADINNLDPITDNTQPIVAMHDLNKIGAIYDGIGTKLYLENQQPIGTVFGSKLQLGSDWL